VKKKLSIAIVSFLIVLLGLFFGYFNNTQLSNPCVRAYYQELKDSLKSRGLSTRLLVVSTKRYKWHNNIQVHLSGAAKQSRHLVGDAIDFIVFDINRDGSADSKDVDIVFHILDKSIIKNNGGLGTYKKEKLFFYKQMVHIDCRGRGSRWYY
jgi:uncharacterized protein YcbK (DUF882 family)